MSDAVFFRSTQRFFCSWIIQPLNFSKISMIKRIYQFDEGLLRVRAIDDESGDRVHVSNQAAPRLDRSPCVRLHLCVAGTLGRQWAASNLNACGIVIVSQMLAVWSLSRCEYGGDRTWPQASSAPSFDLCCLGKYFARKHRDRASAGRIRERTARRSIVLTCAPLE